MKVIQTVAGINQEASGPSYSVPGLCNGLLDNGVDVEIHKIGKQRCNDFRFKVYGYPAEKLPVRTFWRSPAMRDGLCQSGKTADIIHTNGLWTCPNVYPGIVVKKLKWSQNEKRFGPKLVTAPRGCFAKWAWNKGWLKKHIFGWFFGQFAALRATDMWHATCEKEYHEIRALGYKQPVAIVPIGMEIPDVKKEEGRRKSSSSRPETGGQSPEGVQDKSSRPEARGQGPELGGGSYKTGEEDKGLRDGDGSGAEGTNLRRVVFLGRIHKVKGVDVLVKAWAKLVQGKVGSPSSSSRLETRDQRPETRDFSSNSFDDWELVIAGPDCGALEEVKKIIADEDLPRVRFVGELNGQAKYDFFASADLYVLPTITENFGITVAESLACGTPVITTTGTMWSGLNGRPKTRDQRPEDLVRDLSSSARPEARDQRPEFGGQRSGASITDIKNSNIAPGAALVSDLWPVASALRPVDSAATGRCGWWVERSVDNIAAAMKEAMEMPREELAAMGERGKEWIRRDFTWAGVGKKMKMAYEWLLDPEHVERPEWVRID